MATYQAVVTKAKVTSIKALEIIEAAVVGRWRSVSLHQIPHLLSCLTCFSHPVCSFVTSGCSGTAGRAGFCMCTYMISYQACCPPL